MKPLPGSLTHRVQQQLERLDAAELEAADAAAWRALLDLPAWALRRLVPVCTHEEWQQKLCTRTTLVLSGSSTSYAKLSKPLAVLAPLQAASLIEVSRYSAELKLQPPKLVAVSHDGENVEGVLAAQGGGYAPTRTKRDRQLKAQFTTLQADTSNVRNYIDRKRRSWVVPPVRDSVAGVEGSVSVAQLWPLDHAVNIAQMQSDAKALVELVRQVRSPELVQFYAGTLQAVQDNFTRYIELCKLPQAALLEGNELDRVAAKLGLLKLQGKL